MSMGGRDKQGYVFGFGGLAAETRNPLRFSAVGITLENEQTLKGALSMVSTFIYRSQRGRRSRASPSGPSGFRMWASIGPVFPRPSSPMAFRVVREEAGISLEGKPEERDSGEAQRGTARRHGG